MTIDDLLKTLVLQMPAVAICLYALNRLYTDARADHEAQMKQRDEQISAINNMSTKLDTLINQLKK